MDKNSDYPPTTSPSRSSSSSPDALDLAPPPPSNRSLLPWFILATAISQYSLSRISHHGSVILLALIVGQFALGAVWSWTRLLLRGQSPHGLGWGSEELVLGWRFALVAIFQTLAARVIHVTIWSALQVFTTPLLSLFGFFESSLGVFGSVLVPGVVGVELATAWTGTEGLMLSLGGVIAGVSALSWTKELLKRDGNVEQVLFRINMHGVIATGTIHLFNSILQVHTTPLSHASISDVLAFIAFPFSSAIALHLLTNLADHFSASSHLTSIVFGTPPLLVLMFGAIVGQAGAATASLRVWLVRTLVIGLLLSYTTLSSRIPEDFKATASQPTSRSPSTRRPLVLLSLFPLALWILLSPRKYTSLPRSQPSRTIHPRHRPRPLRSTSSRRCETSRTYHGSRVHAGEGDILSHYDATDSFPLPWFASSAPPTTPAITTKSTSPRPLAAHTIFLQSHLAWDWIALPRLSSLLPTTGFLSLGPYVLNHCGSELGSGTYEGVKMIWNVVRGRDCDRAQTGTWAGQMVVSRERIMGREKSVYQKLLDMVEAPDDDPIHEMWGPKESGGRSNPTFGHSLERSWPLVFDCDDPELARKCGNEVWKVRECQCLDE